MQLGIQAPFGCLDQRTAAVQSRMKVLKAQKVCIHCLGVS